MTKRKRRKRVNVGDTDVNAEWIRTEKTRKEERRAHDFVARKLGMRRVEIKYDPGQARDESGKWTTGGGRRIGGSAPKNRELPKEREDLNQLMNRGVSGRGLAGFDDWSFADEDERATVKNKLVTDIAEGMGGQEHYDTANAMVKQWSISSNDHDMRPLGLQRDAAKEFDVPLSEWQKKRIAIQEEKREWSIGKQVEFAEGKKTEEQVRQGHRESSPSSYSLADQKTQRSFMRSMYNNTQRDLAGQGYKPGDKIRLFRGVDFSAMEAADFSIGDTVPIIGNALESWSISDDVASGFGNIVFEMMVPVEMIVGTAQSGLGCLTEGEFVVLGSLPGEARVHEGGS